MIIKNKKKIFSFIFVLFLGTGLFFLAPSAHAQVGTWAGEILGNLISVFISALMVILGLVMTALVSVAQFSNFIGAPAVAKGWSIVRDVCNMFFVLILLVIAFATILKIENYSYKKWLPKLILMAILINFSKTICGLLIDAAQVVMLTFVNAFKDIAAGNLVDSLGITQILTLADNNTDVGFWAIVSAYFLGLVYTIIALVVITTMLAVLVMRIVIIWIYVVLSPAAYLLSAFPGGQKYAGQWWSEFTKNLIVGPVLAFFIWLSFVSLQTQNFATDFPVAGNREQNAIQSRAGGLIQSKSTSTAAMSASKASTPDVFIKFVIAIGMLIGGLKISQEIGGAAGGVAGKGMAKINQGASFVSGAVSGAVGGYALAKARSVGRGTRNAATGASGWVATQVGTGLATVGKPNAIRKAIGQSLQSVGAINSQWRKDAMQKTKDKNEKKRTQFLEKIGMGEKSMDATNEFLKKDSGKNTTNIVGAAGTGAAVGAAFGPAGMIAGGLVGGGLGALQGLLAPLSKYLDKKGNEQTKNGNPVWGDVLKGMGKQAAAVHSFATETTQKGAAMGTKKINKARKTVQALADDPGLLTESNGLSLSTLYTKSGQEDGAVSFLDQLQSGNNSSAAKAITNAENWAGSMHTDADKKKYNYDSTVPHQKARLEAMIQGIAAYKIGNNGKNDVSQLANLINKLNAVSDIGTVEDQEKKVIANRKTGKVGEQGSGVLAVETFAKNDTTKGNRDIIGVDFNKMKGTGLDPKAEGSFPTGSEVGPIIQALAAQIKAERTNLVAQKADGSIDEAKFIKENAILDKAEGRLANPDFKDIRLQNTASANYGRQEGMTSVYHEEIHKGGVEDEDLTERMAQSLMANKLYGRNPQTKGRHATEIAEKAAVMKDKGVSNDVIMVEVDKEIKAHLSAEGASRAARVIRMEKGEKETESQVIEGKVSEPIRETVVEAASEKIGKPEEKQVAQKGEEKVVEPRAVEEKTNKPESETAGETASETTDEATEEPKGPNEKPAAKTEQPTLNTEELQKALETLTEKVNKTATSFKTMPGGSKTSSSNNNLLYPLKQLNINMRKIPAAISKISGGAAPTTIIEASAINDAVNNTVGSDFGGEASSEGGSETGGKTSA